MLKIPVSQSLAGQVAAIISERVSAGTYGSTLPSERNLAVELKVSRTTIRAAMQALSAAGSLPTGEAKKLRKLPGRRPRRASCRFRVLGFRFQGKLSPEPRTQNPEPDTHRLSSLPDDLGGARTGARPTRIAD